MTQPKRCDVCRLKATLDPRTLYDVLSWIAPPVELLAAIDRWVEAQPHKVPQEIKDYRAKWSRLMDSEPVPEVDKFEAPVQGTLIDGGRKVTYG